MTDPTELSVTVSLSREWRWRRGSYTGIGWRNDHEAWAQQWCYSLGFLRVRIVRERRDAGRSLLP